MEEPEPRRAAFLDANCGGDAALRAEVQALLQAREAAGGFLARAAWQPAPAWQPGPGTRVGVYEITGEIGAGGMGSVFMAQRADQHYGRKVAVKILRPECRAPGYVKRFQREIRILARLDHPNVVRIVDAGVTPDGTPFLVMDLISGLRLDHYCQKLALSLRSNLQLFLKICRAVAYLHANGVLHRDLKPSNILVTGDGSPKLVDFGIAIVTDRADPAITHTNGSLLLLTPGYASPEQVRQQLLTPASDVYSLGAILYELVTGVRPYEVEGRQQDIAALAEAMSQGHPAPASTRVSRPYVAEPIRALRKALAGDLDRILLQALAPAPEERYASAAELAEDIERYLRRESILAAPAGPLRRGARRAWQNPRMAAATLVAAAGITLGIGEHVRASRLEERRQMAEKREKEARTMLADLWRDTPPGGGPQRLSAGVRRIAGPWKDALGDSARISPGKSPDRAKLLDEGASYLDAARRSGARDPALLAQIAAAYLNLAEIAADRKPDLLRKAEVLTTEIAPGPQKEALDRRLRDLRFR